MKQRMKTADSRSGALRTLWVAENFEEIGALRKFVYLGLIFLSAVFILAPGIAQISGVTTRDEYDLIYRTVLSMMERNDWLVPHLDGIPRINKPPMIYWLTRSSFELMGAHVLSGRIVSVLFSAALIVVVVLMGREYTGSFRFGLRAGLIALSTIGLAVQGRFLMLDIPTAALSGLAFYIFLRWRHTQQLVLLMWVSMCLACGFLTKGPVTLVVFGSGVMAECLTNPEFRSALRRAWTGMVVAALLFLILSIPWFAYVYALFPEQTLINMQQEWNARQLGTLNLGPITALTAVFFPWSCILFAFRNHAQPAPNDTSVSTSYRSTMLLWLLLSLSPFFFFKFSERYIFGSLIPLSLLCSGIFQSVRVAGVRAYSRLALILTSFAVLLSCALSWWFKTSFGELVVVVIGYVFFAVTWWRGAPFLPMAISSGLLWMTIVGLLYPSFGSNAIPSRILNKLERQAVMLYRESEPAFLPISLRKSLKIVNDIRRDDLVHGSVGNSWIIVGEQNVSAFQSNIRKIEAIIAQEDCYRTLQPVEKLIQGAWRRTNLTAWNSALRGRSLDPLKEDVCLYRLGDAR